jgi:hypothetical protein
VFGLLAGVTFEADWIRPGQITAFFGQKVEENFQASHPSFDGGRSQSSLALVINKCINVVHAHFRPGLRAEGHKLANIAYIINRSPPTWGPPLEVLPKLFYIFSSCVHELTSFLLEIISNIITL